MVRAGNKLIATCTVRIEGADPAEKVVELASGVSKSDKKKYSIGVAGVV